jgi:hypothetical protein
MPNYSRSHLGRFIRKMFATEIERELRMLEEYVLDEEVSDDVGESLMARDEDFEPPEVPFQPKPTSVSISAAPEASGEFSGESNFTTVPKADRHDDIHGANTVILAEGRGRLSRPPPLPPPRTRAATHPPPQPPPAPRTRPVPHADGGFDDVHSAPTMIIDVGRLRGRDRG